MTGRGETGSILGLEPARVRQLLLAFHDRAYGESFRPRDAAAYFVSDHDVTEEQGRQLAQAYLRVPGVKPVDGEEGTWRSGNNVRPLIDHREWRLPTGRLDLAGARWVIEAVGIAEKALGEVPDTVEAMRDRCRRAVASLEGRDHG